MQYVMMTLVMTGMQRQPSVCAHARMQAFRARYRFHEFLPCGLRPCTRRCSHTRGIPPPIELTFFSPPYAGADPHTTDGYEGTHARTQARSLYRSVCRHARAHAHTQAVLYARARMCACRAITCSRLHACVCMHVRVRAHGRCQVVWRKAGQSSTSLPILLRLGAVCERMRCVCRCVCRCVELHYVALR